MTANIPMLLVAVVLLWLPRSWMRRGLALNRRRNRSSSGGQDAASWNTESLVLRREFSKARNYYDLFRAFAGTLVLVGGNGSLADVRAALVPRGDSPLSVVAIQAAVLLIGLVLQTLRYERGRWALTAPVFYIGGLLAVLCTPWAGLCAFVLAWVLTSVAPNAQGFLMVQAMVAAIVAYWLNGLNLFLILGFVLGVVPVILSLLMKKPLVVFSRRSMSAARGVSS